MSLLEYEYDSSTTAALSDARRNAMVRGGYQDTSPPDPDALTRESIRALEPVAPSAGVAAALLSVTAAHPVPLDRESLEPTGEPLTSLVAVDAHWRVNLTDGVGVRAGTHSNGSTTFALRGTLAALRGWLTEVGTEVNEVRGEHDQVISSSRTYRPTIPFVQIGWTAPPSSGVRAITSFGAGLIEAEKQLRSNADDQERALAATAWLAWTAAAVWTVAPDSQRRLVVRSHRIAKGVDVVGEGEVIPWHVRRGNGWTCAAPNVPIAGDAPLSPWLADAVGGTWKAVR
jgi:hypothetical protein